MVKLNEIVKFLDEFLFINEIPDSSNNGLQVQGNEKVTKVAVCVDACISAFEKAKEQGAELIICHHGLSWKDSLKYITNNNYKRISYLIKNGISLYAAHLPLDMHKQIGNNILFAKMLKLVNIKPFGRFEKYFIGYKGEFEISQNIDNVIAIINKNLNTSFKVLPFGNHNIKTVAIISGKGGSDMLKEAINDNIDLFITGEISHGHYHIAKEGNINVIAAGHYKTETLGVKAIASVLKHKFDIDYVFIDVPTGL